jgi:hypothetical protein
MKPHKRPGKSAKFERKTRADLREDVNETKFREFRANCLKSKLRLLKEWDFSDQHDQVIAVKEALKTFGVEP